MKRWKKISLTLIAIIMVWAMSILYLGYRQYRDAIAEVSVQEKIEEIRSQEHYVPYEELSPYLIDATIAVEDHRFFSHNGFDVLATARALFNNCIGNGMKSGGSTITQQLAKNMYFGYEPSLTRKIAELFVAYDLELQLSKEEILALYVNVINYGDQHIGIWEATHGYFQMETSELDLAQASLLAGLPQSPANYQLSNHYDNAKKRQRQVLEAMVKRKMISEEEMFDVLGE